MEVAQLEASTAMMGEGLLGFAMNGAVSEPMGNVDPEFAPHNNYPCAGDDRWVSIAVRTQEEWMSFCAALDSPDLAQDPRFADRYLRHMNRAELDKLVAAWTSQRGPEEVTELLQGVGVAAMTVMHIGDQFQDDHFHQRNAFLETEHPHIGAEWLYGQPWVMSDVEAAVRRPAPLLGQHNGHVFVDLLGVPAPRLQTLEESGAVH